MSQSKSIGRRRFIREAAAGGAGLTAVARAPAFLSQRSPNAVVGIASIGAALEVTYPICQVQLRRAETEPSRAVPFRQRQLVHLVPSYLRRSS